MAQQQVWIVDPDQVYGSVYKRLLADNTCQLEQMGSAEHLFLKLQQSAAPDLIVLEKWQPDMDGFRACKLFKQLRTCHDIPVILVSEAQGLSDQAEAQASGAFDYFSKPFEAELFCRRVREALHLRQQEQQAERLFLKPPAVLQEVDPLTCLPGQSAFRSRLQAAYQAAQDQAVPLSLFFIDLDFFKFYNEYFGQAQGDQSLKKIAALFQKMLPAAQLFRLQEDDFALFTQDTREKALKTGTLICKRLELLAIDHAPLTDMTHLSASIGTATLVHAQQIALDNLQSAAQEALYQAKTWGRNQVRQFFEL